MIRVFSMIAFIVLFVRANTSFATDTARIRKDQLWFKVDMINSGNFFWLGSGFGLGYVRTVNNYIDAGGEIGGNFGPSLVGNGDVYGMAWVFNYKALAEYKPVSRQKHSFKMGLGFTGSIIGGDNLFGFCNKFTWQVNRKKKAVVGLYASNDLYFNKALDRPLDIFGFGFFVGGRF